MQLITVTLPSGNLAVYEQPAEAGVFTGPAASRPEDPAERARAFGRQVAHELGGTWYKPGGWVATADPRDQEAWRLGRSVTSAADGVRSKLGVGR